MYSSYASFDYSIYHVGTIQQIPQIFYSLQDSVKAVLLGCVATADWFEKGVPTKSFVEEWTPSQLGSNEDGREGGGGGGSGGPAVVSNGQYLYIHGSFGLAKVGSGYGNTQKVLYTYIVFHKMLTIS